MFSGITKKLVSIIRPPPPRMVILSSRSIAQYELQLMSQIFDEVIVEDAPRSQQVDQQASSDPKNVWYATRVRHHETTVSQQKLDSGSAVWTYGRDHDFLTLMQPPGTEPITMRLSRSPELIVDLDSAEFSPPTDASKANGLIVMGELERIPVSGEIPAFILLKDDDRLVRAIATAAKSSLYNRLTSGFTGLET